MSLSYRLQSLYQPTGDQPQAIAELVRNLKQGQRAQTLLGVTGSGKTFTMANVIAQMQRPSLVISHNKTLAAQLYSELKEFFPKNAVEYFVSYYDYYQPEAYIPSRNVYIEKDLSINAEIEKMRLRAASALLSGRRDVVIVASVSCIYGMSNPEEFAKNVYHVKTGEQITRDDFLHQLVHMAYSRNEVHFARGHFRVKGDTVDLFLAYEDYAYRFSFFGDEIDEIIEIDPETGGRRCTHEQVDIYPANLFAASQANIEKAIVLIEEDLDKQVQFFLKEGKEEEATRLEERTRLDIDMLRELGYCSGIENYSRCFDGRAPGERPYCLLDYFPEDYLVFIDESHVSIPQIRGMWGGDHARKKQLVHYGFRIPAAMDNRPLHIDEFEPLVNQVIYVSATPAEYELKDSEGVIVEQIIRPTGLVDPSVTIIPTKHQVDHLLQAVHERIQKRERTLVITLTKKMAEELSQYMKRAGIACDYIHSEIKTLDRVAILESLRQGDFDVLIGVNLLREGLDLPEVSLVAILDADKEGFLRNARSLIQMIGRAARHVNGSVLMYADQVTPSMQQAIDETDRRRKKQLEHNREHGIAPQAVKKADQTLGQNKKQGYVLPDAHLEASDSLAVYMNEAQLKKKINQLEKKIEKLAADMSYIEADLALQELTALRKVLQKS